MSANIVVVFPKLDDAKKIKNMLVRNGFNVAAICTTGAQALAYADSLSMGIMVCAYRLEDMRYSDICENLPGGFKMLLLTSNQRLAEGIAQDVMTLAMPFVMADLLDTLQMMVEACIRRKAKKKATTVRSARELKIISDAKRLLMNRNNLTEDEAHRYLQKCSMDSGVNIIESAEMVLTMFD